MGGRLVGDGVEPLAAPDQLGFDLGRVADQGDRLRAPLGCRRPRPAERLVQRIGQAVNIADVPAPLRSGVVDLYDQRHALVHRHGQWLGTAHAA